MLTDDLVARIRSPTPVVFKQVTSSIPLGHVSEHLIGIFPMGNSLRCVPRVRFSIDRKSVV